MGEAPELQRSASKRRRLAALSRTRDTDEHLPAAAPGEHMQGVWRIEHMPAPAPEEPMQGVWRMVHQPTPAPEELMPCGGSSICQHQRSCRAEAPTEAGAAGMDQWRWGRDVGNEKASGSEPRVGNGPASHSLPPKPWLSPPSPTLDSRQGAGSQVSLVLVPGWKCCVTRYCRS